MKVIKRIFRVPFTFLFGALLSFGSLAAIEVNLELTAPDCPLLLSPANGETGVPYIGGTFINFMTSGSANPGNYWRLFYGTDPENLIIGGGYPVGGNGNVGTIIQLQANTIYYWKILEFNADGEASDCDLFSFETNGYCPLLNLTIGDPCDDGLMNTVDDTVNHNCICQGIPEDSDGDGVLNSIDNCMDVFNPTQLDLDNDLVGDECDIDIDGDGNVNDIDCDPMDNTVYYGATCDDGISETEDETLNSVCVCEGTYTDSDGDGFPDFVDNCPIDYNVNQEDYDNDGLGDSCDDDMDGDGFIHGIDCDDENELIYIGAPCDDGNPESMNDQYNDQCICLGELPFDCEVLGLNFGDPCDDGNPITTDDYINELCECDSDEVVNDTCKGSLEILCGSSLTGSTSQANSDPNLQSCDTELHSSPGVWFKLVGVAKDVTINSFGSSFDTKLGVYEGPCENLTCVSGNDNVHPVEQSEVTFYAKHGVEYFVYLAGYLDNSGDYVINVSCEETAENSICWEPVVVNEGFIFGAQILGGTGSSNNCFVGSTNSIWYKYVPTQEGECVVTSDIDLDEPDTRVSIYSGTCDSLVCVMANDDYSVTNFSAYVSFPVQPGEQYFIEWDDRWSADEFDFEISVSDYDCVELSANIGDACDDGNPLTTNDFIQEDCSCVGIIPCNTLNKQTLEICYNAWGGSSTNLNWYFNNNDPVDNNWTGVTVDPISGCVSGLVLRNKNLDGIIPEEIGDLQSLWQLRITENPNLVGSIPSSLGDLYYLQVLNLSLNNLSGNLPSSLGYLGFSLWHLNLTSNNLTGCIPPSWYYLCLDGTDVYLHNNPQWNLLTFREFCVYGWHECIEGEADLGEVDKRTELVPIVPHMDKGPRMQLFPNPNDGFLLEMRIENYHDVKKDYSIRIMNAMGQEVRNELFTSNGSNFTLQMDLSYELGTGLYMVIFDDGEFRQTKKLIIE